MATRLCLTFFALVITVVQSVRIAHIDPVTSFSARYYSQDKPVLASTNKLSDEFTLRASPSDTFPKDRLRVRFTVPDLEDFDLTLNLDPVVSERTRIIAGVPGDEHEVPVTPATYSSTTTNEDGTATIATFTVMNDGLLDGLVIRDGDIYQVTPTAFLEADAATMEDPEEQQAAISRVSALRTRSKTGMAIYKLSDVQTHAADGTPYYGCKALHYRVNSTSHDHVDEIGLNPPLFTAVSRATAVPGMLDSRGRLQGPIDDDLEAFGVFGRKSLLTRWSESSASASGEGKVVYLDLVVDIGAALGYSGSKTTVNTAVVTSRLQSLVTKLNAIYHTQLAVHLSLNTVLIRTGLTSERWNVYANSKSITPDGYIAEATQYRKSQPDNQHGAAQLFITRAFSTGVVGMAYTHSLCVGEASTGFSSVRNNELSVVAHQLRDIFGGDQVFEICPSSDGSLLYTNLTGGIMDNNNGDSLGYHSDSPNEVSFHSLYSSPEMCSRLRDAVSGIKTTTPHAQCFSSLESNPSVCGNGVLEGAEECDVGSMWTPCCVDCKLTVGATCISNINTSCCNNCRLVPVTSSCTPGTCTSSLVSSSFCRDGTGREGTCSGSTCIPVTYSWKRVCNCQEDPPTQYVFCVASDSRKVSSSYCDPAEQPSASSCCGGGTNKIVVILGTIGGVILGILMIVGLVYRFKRTGDTIGKALGTVVPQPQVAQASAPQQGMMLVTVPPQGYAAQPPQGYANQPHQGYVAQPTPGYQPDLYAAQTYYQQPQNTSKA